jgi:hypothetical protein
MRRIAFAVAAFAPALLGLSAAAQEAASASPTAEQLIETAREVLRPREVRGPCRAPEGNEIVVCAPDADELRVEPSPNAGTGGNPRAPDTFGIPPGGTVVVRGCFLQACPRPMPPLIDLKAIPEAPPGSDAARYAEQ